MLYSELSETSAPFRLVKGADRWHTSCAECERVAVVHMGTERPSEFGIAASRRNHASWCGSHDAEVVTQAAADERAEFDRRKQAARSAGYDGVNVYAGPCSRCRANVPALSGGFFRDRPRGVSVYHLDEEFCRAEVARMALLRAPVGPRHRTTAPQAEPQKDEAAPAPAPEVSRADLLELD